VTGSITHRCPTTSAGPTAVIEVERDISVSHIATFVYAAMLPVVELWFLILDPSARPHTWLAILAAAIVVPLHLRIVWLALNSKPQPHAGLVVAIMAVVTLGAGLAIGAAWVKMFAIVGATGLIVLPRRSATVTVVGSVAASWVLAASVEPAQYSPPGLAFVNYLALSVAWRSIALFALVWLVTSYRRLVRARTELRTEAVGRERQRVHAELANAVDARLARLVTLGRRYEAVDPAEMHADLVHINREAADALAQTRQLIAGYRANTRGGELRAAAALLAATGINAEILADDVDLGAPADAPFSTQLQAAVQQALDHTSHDHVAFRVRPVDGATSVELWTPDGGKPTDAV
jgi:hypothetical protein